VTRATQPVKLDVKEVHAQGARAYRFGCAVNDNPYTEPAWRKVWLNGFFDAAEGKNRSGK
jgi:ribosome modulation factor